MTGNGTDSYLDKDYLSPWINLAITWSQIEGLTLYIDGRIRAKDPDGYRKFRLVDQETMLVIGRRNDYLGDAINMTFEECVMMERVMKPYEIRESLAKMGKIVLGDTFVRSHGGHNFPDH